MVRCLWWILRSHLIDLWNVDLKIRNIILSMMINSSRTPYIVKRNIIESEDPHLNSLQVLCLNGMPNSLRPLICKI